MASLEDLLRLGWSLSESGFGHLLSHYEDETPSASELATFALDFDLKMIGKQCLPDNHQESGKLTGPMVLQISKIRNISAPKINPHSQTAPRNDKIIFHEGSIFGHVESEALKKLFHVDSD